MPTLSAISIFPIKSCGGVSVQFASAEERGLALDRRWMIVDERGKFLTQRDQPRLALVRTAIQRDSLSVSAPGMRPMMIPMRHSRDSAIRVSIWGDAVDASAVSKECDDWFSRYLQIPCRLVRMKVDSERSIDGSPDGAPTAVSFADAFPYHLLSEDSLRDLNRRLKTPLPMNRFRPNLVITGCAPYEEDRWERIRVGTAQFRVVKPCDRCVVTTTDQETALRGDEPLATLSTYRRKGTQTVFGQMLVLASRGRLAVGDSVEPLT